MKLKSLLFLFILSVTVLSVLPIPFLPVKVEARTLQTGSANTGIIDTLSTNWPALWQKINKYTKWDLERYDGSEWVSVKSDLQIDRKYPNEDRCKITLIFDAGHNGSYRLTFGIDARVKDYAKRLARHRYELEYDEFKVVFDWSDVIAISGLQLSHGVKNVDDKDYFWFRIRRDNVPLGAHVEIDPSIVATSTQANTIAYPYHRKGFYAAGRYWAFYSDGTNAVYESTTDPDDWSGSATSIGAVQNGRGHQFSVWFDGTHIHYARQASYDLFYRRGTPESDGTITWSAAEQLVYNGTNGDFYYIPTISVDSEGYAWIGVAYYDEPLSCPYVFKNAYNNGTWSTAANFPYQLSSTDEAYWRVCPVPLTSQKMYVIYSSRYFDPWGRLYDGADFGSNENTLADYDSEVEYEFSAVAVDDDVHFVYNRENTYQIRYNKRVYGTGWETNDVLIQNNTEKYTSPVLSLNTTNNDLYCFWSRNDTDHVYYKQYDNSTGNWDADPTDWIDESTDGIHDQHWVTSWYQTYSGCVGLLYLTKTSSPYNIKFAHLGTPTPSNNSPEIGEFSCSAETVYANEWFSLNATVQDGDGIAELKNCTVDLTDSVILAWDNQSDTFSIHDDPSGYCYLNTTGCIEHEKNSSSFELSWRLLLTWSYPDGNIDIQNTNTKVYDVNEASGSASHNNLFSFEPDLRVASASPQKTTFDKAETVTVNGSTLYQGKDQAPQNTTGVTAKIEHDSTGSVVASTSSFTDGDFTVSFPAPETQGYHNYTVYTTANPCSVENQTFQIYVSQETTEKSGGFLSSSSSAYTDQTPMEAAGIPAPISPGPPPEAQYGTIILILIVSGATVWYLRKPATTGQLWKQNTKRKRSKPKKSRSKRRYG